MAQIGRAGLLQLLRGTGKLRQSQRVPHAGESILALDVTPSQPETSIQLGENAQAARLLDSQTARAPSLPRDTLRRHPSEIGAVCANERPYGSVRGASGN